MKTSFQRRSYGSRGAALLFVLAFTIMGGIAVTAWIYLIAARVIQADRMTDNVSRRLMWGNNSAINQQYCLGYTYRENVSMVQVTPQLSGGWGGVQEDEIKNLTSFDSAYTFSSSASYAYPFNNIRKVPSSDGSVYYTRTTGSSDSTQNEHLLYYNFQKTFPRSLLGDLLVVYTKPSGASGSTYITDNLYVNGRVLINDSTADVSGVLADECLNLTEKGTNTTLNAAGSASQLPQNFPSIPIFTAGYSSAGLGAVVDGSLNMINNTSFLPNSLANIMATTSSGTSGWVECTSSTTTFPTSGTTTYVAPTSTTPAYLRTSYNSSTVSYYPSGTSSSNCTISAQRVTATNNSVDTSTSTRPSYNPILSSGSATGYTTNATYGYRTTTVSSTNPLYTVNLRLKTLAQHVRISSGVDQLIIEGATTSSDYTGSLTTPVIIWVDQETCRDIRFVGECPRPVILATGPGAGTTIYMAWTSTTDLGTTYTPSTSIDWRLHYINEYRNIWINPPGTTGTVRLVGGIRTNWSVNCTDSTSTKRITLVRETNQAANLLALLPRDAWFEPLVVQ